uniref:Cdc2-related protein kinase n=1 Tax=Echinostoma caproni TaxID=27848 RepID=A0A183BEN0_9TREM
LAFFQNDDRKRHHKEKHRHRSRSASSKSYSGTDDDVDTHRRSRHRNRSRSIEADVKKPTNPDSDWRKDLMAGRRRSPPTMPENSYYGFEKRRREHKRSRHRHRSSESEDDHRTRHSHSRSSRRREDSPLRRPRGDSPRDYRQYDRRSGKHREIADPVCANPADRANRFHDRRAQWAQEEDEFRTHGASETSSKQSRHKHLAVSNRRQRQPSDTVESLTPEGPSLPQPPKEPSRQEPQRQVQKVPSTSSSSSGSGSECSSSDDDDDSSSSSGSSSSKSEEVAQIPEGPPLPPGSVHQTAEPEGPALPHTAIAGASMKRRVSHATSSTSSSDASGSESDEEEDGSGSSSGSSSTGSGDSSDSSSEPGDEDEVNNSLSPVKRRRENMDTGQASSEVKRRERVPEGPAVPENYVSKSDQHRRYPDSGQRKPSERQVSMKVLSLIMSRTEFYPHVRIKSVVGSS